VQKYVIARQITRKPGLILRIFLHFAAPPASRGNDYFPRPQPPPATPAIPAATSAPAHRSDSRSVPGKPRKKPRSFCIISIVILLIFATLICLGLAYEHFGLSHIYGTVKYTYYDDGYTRYYWLVWNGKKYEHVGYWGDFPEFERDIYLGHASGIAGDILTFTVKETPNNEYLLAYFGGWWMPDRSIYRVSADIS